MTQRSGGTNNGTQEKDQVIDFNTVREKKLEEKRKNTERIFFRDLLSVFTVTGHSKMISVDLIDVSEDGCSFQVPYEPENPWPKDGNGVPVRIYFSQDMFLEIYVRIQNSRHSIEKNRRYMRFGCIVDKETQSYPAYQQFVRFLKLYSEHAHKDKGNVTIFYL